MLGVGVCFGAIPTHSELLIWRISCVAITVVPIYIFFGYALATMMDSTSLDVILTLRATILYILARAVTLVLAFKSLRELPPGAYETVHWTTLIPHI